ncbi:response regulator [Candidatus Parabeggiatoa sp. HSG14]|uniref:response regulator transcription factor n=1 Tax=Candidatus Parabeggiatoa sp. HSG14 TaxID=3055593 RepID=UPI0025A72DA8|nr:response regulator [Thiotrichales bacterium HSG14]
MPKTVVIVDDSKFLIKKIVAFFENEVKYEVVAQGYDGNDAVALYRKHQPDLIALDITMPNKDGQQAMEEIFAEFPSANILIISAVRGDTVLECMDSGAKGYIEKPLRFTDPEFIQDFKETLDEIFT